MPTIPYINPLSPYDPGDSFTGTAAVVFAKLADVATAVTKPSDILSPDFGDKTIPTLKTGWRFAGLLADSPEYDHDRDADTLGYEQGDLFPQVTNVARSFTIPLGSMNAQNIAMLEAQDTSSTVAAVNGASAYDRVALGIYTSLPLYRVAIIGYSGDPSSKVTASDGSTRPRMIMWVGQRGQLSADSQKTKVASGDPIGPELALDLQPEPSRPGAEHGEVFVEKAGTIVAGS